MTENPLVMQRIHQYGIDRLPRNRFGTVPKDPYAQWNHLNLLLDLGAISRDTAVPFKHVFERYAELRGIDRD